MFAMIAVKDLFVLVSIVGLLFGGAAIALRSGLVETSQQQRSQLLGNLSRLLVTLAGYAVILSMVQHLVGYKLSFLP